MKKTSIFKALDGGHLDGALFGSHMKGTKKGEQHAQSEPPRLSRRDRLRGGRKGIAETGRKRGREKDSDAGL